MMEIPQTPSRHSHGSPERVDAEGTVSIRELGSIHEDRLFRSLWAPGNPFPPPRRARRMSKPELPSTRPPESHDTGARASRASSLMHAVWDFIRPQPWVIKNLRERKSQKLLFRSWLPAWGALLIILPNPWLRTIGNLCVNLFHSMYFSLG